jgi:molybdate transport system ATP-binding protein
VFRDLNWRLERQQHCLIAGPNGCGKSTLLDLLTGDNHKAYGQDVYLFGQRRGSGESVWDIKRRFGRVDARMQFACPAAARVLAMWPRAFTTASACATAPRTASARRLDWLRALDLDSLAARSFTP